MFSRWRGAESCGCYQSQESLSTGTGKEVLVWTTGDGYQNSL
jgi:hypothetical protein